IIIHAYILCYGFIFLKCPTCIRRNSAAATIYNVMLISSTRRGMPAVAAADHCIEMLFWPEPKVSTPPSSLA
ncbi:Uncharacterized protein FWK35_00004861, partial [Aphis craccivora]